MHRKHLIRATLVTALTGALVGGMATAAQAYQPYRVSDPGCIPVVESISGCKAQETYRSVYASINYAIAHPNNAALRQGTIRQLFFEIYGGGLVDWDGYVPIKNSAHDAYAKQAADAWSSPPTDEQLACYGNVFLTNVAGNGHLDAVVNNAYAAINAFKEAKDQYGDIRDAHEYAERFGEAENTDDVQDILFDFLGDQTKESIKDVISESTGLPLSMEDLYFEVIKQSQQPVNQLGNETMMQQAVGPLISCQGNNGNTQDSDSHMPAYKTVTKTVKYTAQQFFKHRTEYNTGKKKSCVNKSHGRIYCATRDKSPKYGNEGWWATTINSNRISLPAAAADVLKWQGSVQKRLTVKVSSFVGPKKNKGYADFELGQTYGGGQWSYKKAGTYNTGWIKYPTSFTNPSNYSTLGMLGISPKTKITIDSVKVEYRYTVLN